MGRKKKKPEGLTVGDIKSLAAKGDMEALDTLLRMTVPFRLNPEDRSELISSCVHAIAAQGPDTLIVAMLRKALEFDSYMLVRAQASATKIMDADDSLRYQSPNLPDPTPKLVEALARVLRIEDRLILLSKAFISVRKALADGVKPPLAPPESANIIPLPVPAVQCREAAV